MGAFERLGDLNFELNTGRDSISSIYTVLVTEFDID